MKIILTDKELKNIFSVLGNCSSPTSKVTYNLYYMLSHYTDSFLVANHDIISNYCRTGNNNNLIYPITFYHATMELTLEKEGFDFLNAILSIANLDLLDDPTNPSGLIFNIKVK